jgi:hypothetical protein
VATGEALHTPEFGHAHGGADAHSHATLAEYKAHGHHEHGHGPPPLSDDVMAAPPPGPPPPALELVLEPTTSKSLVRLTRRDSCCWRMIMCPTLKKCVPYEPAAS